MKMSTMVTYIQTHLSTKVGTASVNGQGAPVKVQQQGKGNVVGSAALASPVANLPRPSWPRMREINYTNSSLIADEYINNQRFVVDRALPHPESPAPHAGRELAGMDRSRRPADLPRL